MARRLVYLIMFALIFMIIPLVSSAEIDIEFNFPQDENLTLPIKCDDAGVLCDSTYDCNVTVYYPNGTKMFSNTNTTKTDSDYVIELPDSSVTGIYKYDPYCYNGTDSGSETKYFEITPNGERPSVAKAILYIGLLLMLTVFLTLSLMAHFNDKGEVWRIWWFGVVWLLAIALTFVSWQMSADFLTSAPFLASMFRILFWFLTVMLFPLVIVLFLFTIVKNYQASKIQDMIEGRGFDMGTAEEQFKRRKRR